MRIAALALLCALLYGSGCARLPPPSPAEALGRYLHALLRDDPQAAYRLLDEPTRRRLPYEAFAAEWRETQAERQAQARALREQLQHPIPVQATVALPDGVRLVLSREDGAKSGGWRLSDADFGAVRPQTPEEAVHLLLSAAEQHNYEAVMRLFSPAQRQVIEAELKERLNRLRAAVERNQPVEVSGSRARFQYDPRFHIDLQKDQSAWQIVDLN